MPIVSMDKINIVGLAGEKAEVMDALMKLGAIELYEPERGIAALPVRAAEAATVNGAALASEIAGIEELILKMKNAIDLSSKFYKEKKPAFSAKRKIQTGYFSKTVSRLREVEGKADRLTSDVSAISNLNAHLIRYRLILDQLKPWAGLKIRVDTPETQYTRIRPGTLSDEAELHKLLVVLESQDSDTDIIELSRYEDAILVCVVSLKANDEKIASLLKGSAFRPLNIPGASGYPDDIIADYEQRAAAASDEIGVLTNECISLASDVRDFEIIYDHASILLEKALTEMKLFHTGYTFILKGWIPSHLTESVEKALNNDFFVAFSHEKATSEDEYPILLKNHPLIKPYEVVTEMFSPPSTKDVDPNPILAPFFLLFFSMMLSDAGYGLVLAAGCALLIWKFKVTGGLRSMCLFMFQGGLVSVIWGLLFGGFFGDILTVVSSGRFSFPTLWFNPIENPIKLMIWSMLFGTMHLFAGLLTKAYILIVTGKWIDAVLDIFTWIILITGLGLLLAGSTSGFPILASAGKYMAIGSAVVLLLFGGRDSKNPIMRIIKGLIGLYSITGYFSDILSYTRILALSLATGVIAMVVNMLGGIAGFGFIGILLFVAVGLLGHTLNLALSTLGCYVHTSRLQYVEFFSKFYEGGGRMWNPMSIKTRYIQIMKDQ
ncbi:MAG: V-type ATP synthase subunit I [Saccharofermentanales bacterium]